LHSILPQHDNIQPRHTDDATLRAAVRLFARAMRSGPH